jgi:hypothetical protein
LSAFFFCILKDHRAVVESENQGVPVLFSEHNLPPMAQIGLTDLPKYEASGFGIGNLNQGPISVLVSEPKLFFPKQKLFFPKFFFKIQIFVMFSHFLGWYRFYLKNLEIFIIIGNKFGFSGPLMMEKIGTLFY